MVDVTKPSSRAKPVPTSLPLGRDTIYWQVMSEPAIFAGGGRALLMQVAHPGVGAGVEQHSSYASDPWGRFFRTMDVMMKLSFGTPEASARQSRMLAKMHQRVVGVAEDGSKYSAMDAVLQRWVWATLVDSALVVYELVRTPLTPTEKARYYDESKLMAYGCGVPVGSCPETWADFQSYIDGVVADDLAVGHAARSVAHATMVPPLPEPLGRLVTVPHQLVTVGLLAPSLRDAFGLEWDDRKERSLKRWIAGAKVTSGVLPRPVRELAARFTVAQRKPLRIGWLQRRGTALTAQRMAQFESVESVAS